MGFFDKKYCDVCGDKIGLLGNRKLEDGNLCKDCAKKLSPFFDDRRNSTVEEIKAQLEYRANNEEVLKAFRATKTFGDNVHLYVDETKGQFVVARNINDGDNHDVINLSQITGCTMDIDESRTEEFRTDNEGKRVSYNPPRYKYSYDYRIILTVNAPYFDEIKIKMNSFSIEQHENSKRNEVERECRQILSYITSVTGVPGSVCGVNGTTSMNGMGMAGMGMAGMGMNQMGMNQMGMNQMGMNQMGMNQMGMNQQYQQGMNPQYQQNQMGMNQQYQQNQMGGNASMEWECTECSAKNTGRFCEFCGSPRK